MAVAATMSSDLTDPAGPRPARSAESVFVAKAAHELRGAVCGIEILAATLAERVDDHGDEELARLLRQLACQSAQVERLADQLLDLDRYDHGFIGFGVESVNLAELLEGTLHNVPTGPDHTIAIDVADDLTIETDPTALRQIITNLVGNAVRHGGGCIELDGRVEGDRLVLDIADDGPGIPDQVRERMFEPFVRSSCAGGNGLGLAIVAELAAALRGEVAYEPNEPTGARFRVSLPVA